MTLDFKEIGDFSAEDKSHQRIADDRRIEGQPVPHIPAQVQLPKTGAELRKILEEGGYLDL